MCSHGFHMGFILQLWQINHVIFAVQGSDPGSAMVVGAVQGIHAIFRLTNGFISSAMRNSVKFCLLSYLCFMLYCTVKLNPLVSVQSGFIDKDVSGNSVAKASKTKVHNDTVIMIM